jgi:hypothetical protein
MGVMVPEYFLDLAFKAPTYPYTSDVAEVLSGTRGDSKGSSIGFAFDVL